MTFFEIFECLSKNQESSSSKKRKLHQNITFMHRHTSETLGKSANLVECKKNLNDRRNLFRVPNYQALRVDVLIFPKKNVRFLNFSCKWFRNNTIRRDEDSPPQWALMFTMDCSLLNLHRKQLIICESLRKMNNIFSELSKLASLKYNSETSSFVTKNYFRLHSIGARSILRAK